MKTKYLMVTMGVVGLVLGGYSFAVGHASSGSLLMALANSYEFLALGALVTFMGARENG